MLAAKLIIFLISTLRLSYGQKYVEIKLIQDFLKKQIEPSVVTAFLCWQKDDLVKLQNVFSEENSFSVTRNLYVEKLNIPYKELHLIVLDLSCGNSDVILEKANNDTLFRIKFRWLILSEIKSEQNLSEVFAKCDILVDSRVVLAQRLSDLVYSLDYIYKIDRDNDVILHKYGDWESDKGFLTFKNDILSWKRRKLKGHNMRTSYVYTNNDTLNHLEDYRYNNVDTQMKLNYLINKHLFEFMNSTMVIMFDDRWGEYVGRNKYTGLLGRLHRKEIDIAGSPLFCVKERLAFYDCVAMTTPAIGFFLFRQPPLSYVANIFTLPFETNLWLTDIAFLVVCSLFMYLVVVWEWKIIDEGGANTEYDIMEKSFWETVMFTISTVSQQGYPTEPKSGSGKIIILTLCFTLIFMFTAYSANTVVLFQSSASNIRTLEDLYNSKMTLGVDDQQYFRFWFPRIFEPLRRKIYLERITPKGEKEHYYEIKEGIERARKGYFAFHIDEVNGYKVISDTFQEHEKCGIRTIEYLYVKDPWMTAPKNSSFREIFHVGHKLLSERGIVKREIKQLYTQKPECVTQGSNFRSAGILDLYSVYMLFFFGLAGSVGLLIIECISKKLIEPYMCSNYSRKRDLKIRNKNQFINNDTKEGMVN